MTRKALLPKFVAGFIGAELAQTVPQCDSVNLACEEQLPLAEFLTTLAKAAGFGSSPALVQVRGSTEDPENSVTWASLRVND
eukprot:4243841-Amphidinium_carterae.1